MNRPALADIRLDKLYHTADLSDLSVGHKVFMVFGQPGSENYEVGTAVVIGTWRSEDAKGYYVHSPYGIMRAVVDKIPEGQMPYLIEYKESPLAHWSEILSSMPQTEVIVTNVRYADIRSALRTDYCKRLNEGAGYELVVDLTTEAPVNYESRITDVPGSRRLVIDIPGLSELIKKTKRI